MSDKNTNKNDCSFAKDSLLEEIQEGNFGQDSFELFLAKHSDCKDELQDFYQSWNDLSKVQIPEPTGRMDAMFYKSLSEFQAEDKPQEKAKDETKGGKVLFLGKHRSRILQMGVAAAIFFAGILTSFYIFNSDNNNQMMADNDNLESNVILAGYDESESSMDRLSGISKMKSAPELNDKIIESLNKALINDSNINVRLSAIEAMLHYADNPKVRENLIKAIPYQDSPLIQMTLAEVMIELEEENSGDAWKELFGSDNIEPEVKSQLQQTLEPVLNL